MLKEDEEEVRIAIENNEYIANSHVKELLDEIDTLRALMKSSQNSIENYSKVTTEIFNLSRLAWEQVDTNPEEAKMLFKMINSKAKEFSKMRVTCPCVGGKEITINQRGCGETLCKAVEIK